MQETPVWSLGQKDPLEEGMATHPSILAWRTPMDRGAWRVAVHGVAKSWTRLKQLSSCSSSGQTVREPRMTRHMTPVPWGPVQQSCMKASPTSCWELLWFLPILHFPPELLQNTFTLYYGQTWTFDLTGKLASPPLPFLCIRFHLCFAFSQKPAPSHTHPILCPGPSSTKIRLHPLSLHCPNQITVFFSLISTDI